jgi:hypothetical protein
VGSGFCGPGGLCSKIGLWLGDKACGLSQNYRPALAMAFGLFSKSPSPTRPYWKPEFAALAKMFAVERKLVKTFLLIGDSGLSAEVQIDLMRLFKISFKFSMNGQMRRGDPICSVRN